MDQGNAPIELGKMKENSKCIDAMGNEDMCILVHSEPQALQSNLALFFFCRQRRMQNRTMTIGNLIESCRKKAFFSMSRRQRRRHTMNCFIAWLDSNQVDDDDDDDGADIVDRYAESDRVEK